MKSPKKYFAAGVLGLGASACILGNSVPGAILLAGFMLSIAIVHIEISPELHIVVADSADAPDKLEPKEEKGI